MNTWEKAALEHRFKVSFYPYNGSLVWLYSFSAFQNFLEISSAKCLPNMTNTAPRISSQRGKLWKKYGS